MCCVVWWGAGALQLMQMQEDMKKQIEAGELGEQTIEQFKESKQQMMLDNLWKLNVADIENTLTHVCEKVLTVNLWCSFYPTVVT